jgi:hypothetical protein
MANSFVKDPDAELDYAVDWTEYLGVDVIASSDWIVPTGITGGAEAFTDTDATIWLSGGTAGNNYTVVNRIVTLAGRTDDRTISIFVSDR